MENEEPLNDKAEESIETKQTDETFESETRYDEHENEVEKILLEEHTITDRKMTPLEEELDKKEKEHAAARAVEEARIKHEREELLLQQEALKNERLKLEVEAEKARLQRLQEKQKEEEQRHLEELEEIKQKSKELKEEQQKRREEIEARKAAVEKAKADITVKLVGDLMTSGVSREVIEDVIDDFVNEVIDDAAHDLWREAVQSAVKEMREEETKSPPATADSAIVDDIKSLSSSKLVSSEVALERIKIHRATPEEEILFRNMKKHKATKFEVEESEVSHSVADETELIIEQHNIAAQDEKKGKKLYQGLDISVRSTENNKLRLQWDWTPSILNSGYKVWYSVLVLGTKFGPNINSHKSYKFHNSPLPEAWPMTNRDKMKDVCVQHCWDTYGKVMDIKGLKPRYTYRICVLGRRDRSGQRLTFGHIQFTMPGAPSRPNLKVDRLSDREVALSWEPVTSYGDAYLCGYQLYYNDIPSGDLFTPDILQATISDLEPGTSNKFTLVAVTKHTVGNSRQSRAIKVRCPQQPPVVDEVYQVDTNEIGVILLTWQVPVNDSQDIVTVDEDDENVVRHYQPVVNEDKNADSDDDDFDDGDVDTPRSARVMEASKITCFLTTVDGELYGRCSPDANEKDYIGYEIGNCRIGQEYAISIRSYHEPESFESNDRRVTCGCSSEESPTIKCAPVSPPKAPKPLLKSVSAEGVSIIWERAKEYGSALLSGYLIQINKQIYGERLAANCTSTCLSELTPGLDYKINLIALTEHAVGKQRQTEDTMQETVSVYDSIYNSDDDLSVESYDDGVIMQKNKSTGYTKTKSADSGRRTISSLSDADDLMNFMSTVKTMRNASDQLEKYPACKSGPSLLVNYNNLVVPPDHVTLVDVLGTSAQLAWNFAVPRNIKNSKGMILVRPEVFSVLYWKNGESIATAKIKETKGTRMFLSDLKPGTDYDVVVEAKARHQNQRDAWDPHDPFLCKEQGKAISFRTGHPPMVPTEFSVIGGSTKSLRLAWNEPIQRGVKVNKFLVSVAGPAHSMQNLNLTSTHDSTSTASLNNTPRSGRRSKSKRHVVSNGNNSVQIIPRVYEVPADTVIYEVKNLVERTEYVITLHMVTSHSDSEKVKQLYDSPSFVNTVEDDIWTPYVTTTGITAGIDPPECLHVTKRDVNNISLEWKAGKAYGMYSLLYNIIRWNEIEVEEPESMSTRDKLPKLHARTSGAVQVQGDVSEVMIANLYPGTNFEFHVEACFGTDQIDPERENVITEIALTDKVSAWTSAPPGKPRLLLRSINQDEFELSWDRPVLLDLDTSQKVNMEAASAIRRSLLGYRMEINFDECAILSPSVTSYTYKNPKPGQSYSFLLSAVTCSANTLKERRTRWQELLAGPHSKIFEQKDIPVDYPAEDVDETPSEMITVNTPLRHEVIQFDWLSCKYSKRGSKSSSGKEAKGSEDDGPGTIVVRYKITGKEIEVDSLKIHWTCHTDDNDDDDEEEEHFSDDLDYDSRGYEIHHPKPKSVYAIRVEANFEEYGSPVTISSPTVYCQIPGAPDAPSIACRQITKNGFTLEWNEPQTYGGNEIGGYHVCVNGSKMGKTLPTTCRSCTVPCRPGRTYKVHMAALSSDPGFTESERSNELLVNTQSENYQKSSKKSEKKDKALSFYVNVVSTYDDAIEVEWHQPLFNDGDIVHAYIIQWSTMLQSKPQSTKLLGSQQDYVMSYLSIGTTYFVTVTAYDADGVVIAKSNQLEAQTSANIDTPVLRVGSCSATKVELEWSKPKTYGDAEIEKYLLRLDGCDYADVSKDSKSYVFSSSESGNTYCFQLQAISSKTGYNSQFSQELHVTCPGATAPELYRIKTAAANRIKVCWKKPALKGGATVKSYWVYYRLTKPGVFNISPDDIINDPSVIAHGPIAANKEEDCLDGVNPCAMYNVLLQVDLNPDDCESIYSQPLRTKAAMPPNPPRISAEIVGMEERVQLEEHLYHLTSRRDRLSREINILRGLVVIKHLSDRDEEIARLSKSIAKIDNKMTEVLREVKKYTGTVMAILRWNFPGHDGDAVATGYQIYVNQRQYGGDLSVHTTNALVELPCDMRPHVVTVVTTTNHPVGSSNDSNVIKISTEEFFPFSFFCYFDTHVRGARFPAIGCCNYEESLQVEMNRKHDKPGKAIPYRGLLDKKIPPPCAEGLEIRSGEWKPIVEKTGKPTFILFWTKWCRASIRLMKFLTQYAEDNPQDFAFVSCCTHSGESSKIHLHKLTETFQQYGWSELASVRHLCTCQQNVDNQLIRRRLSVNTFALSSTAELYGVVGVPSIVIVNAEGYVSWQGRLCALSYNSFSQSVRHIMSQVSRIPCDVHDCTMCTAESHQDFNHVEYNQADFSSNKSTPRSSVKQNFFPGLSTSSRSKKDIKKKMRANPNSSASTGYSPRILAYSKKPTHPHSKSSSPRFDNPYEEVFIQEILTPRQNKRNNSIFPNIEETPTKTRRIRISAGPKSSRRTISAPSVENKNLKKVYSQ